MVRQSQEFARRLEQIRGDHAAQIVAAYRFALGREPKAQERDALAAFAAKHGLANACRVIWNTNEFVFVD